MWNQQMEALGKKNSVIREIFEYSRRRKAEIGEENVFDFSLGNPSIPAPAAVTDALRRLIDQTDPVALHGYTSAPGDLSVRAAIARGISARFGVPADPGLIYMTCGAAASLTITLKALLCPGDEVVIPSPFFPEYRVFAATAGAQVRAVDCLADFQLDLAALERALTPRTGAVLINSPNNPTGAVFSEESLRGLAEILERASKRFGRRIWIISDEPYRELVYDGATVPFLPALYPNTAVCYSYSKSLSLPGERIGYIFIPPQCEHAGDLFAAVCGAGRSLGYVCAPALWQYVVGQVDGTPPDLSAYDRNRTRLYRALTGMGYEAVPPQGAFYLFVRALEPDANAFCGRAKRHELLLVPSDDFGCPGWVRAAYCVSPAQIERSLPAFAALYEEYKGERS